MKHELSAIHDEFDGPQENTEDQEDASEDDLWFLPGPMEEEPDFLPPGPQAEPNGASLITDWAKAEAVSAARLAHVAGLFGGLNERVARGPEGWRHRLALIEAANLSWFVGDRVTAERVALWMSLRLSGAQDDTTALARISWAVRRLTGGPDPMDDMSSFLDRRDPEYVRDETERFEDRADEWRRVMEAAAKLHPITRACMGFHLWSLAGLGQQGDRLEAAVTAARIAAGGPRSSMFAPMALGGADGLRAGGTPERRLSLWLGGLEAGCLTAMRHLDDIEAWSARAEAVMAGLSGKTPPALRKVLTEWPLVSAPMAESLTGASRAAVQRNLLWAEGRGLIREVTRQGRFRMWKADH